MQHENTRPRWKITLAHLYVRLKRHKWRLGDPRGAIETRVNARKVRQYFMDNFSPREAVSRKPLYKRRSSPLTLNRGMVNSLLSTRLMAIPRISAIVLPSRRLGLATMRLEMYTRCETIFIIGGVVMVTWRENTKWTKLCEIKFFFPSSSTFKFNFLFLLFCFLFLIIFNSNLEFYGDRKFGYFEFNFWK